MGKVMLTHASYTGGLGDIKSIGDTNLIATDTTLGLGVLTPKKAAVDWTDVAWVDVEDDEVRKSRAGKVAAFGVAGLLASKTQIVADVTVGLRDGRVVRYQVKNATARTVRGSLDPLLRAAGVPWRDEGT